METISDTFVPWILNCVLYACLTDETNFLSRCKIGDMRFLSQEFSETRSTCSGSWLPLYRTVEETLFVNHILHITCKIFSKSMNVYQQTLFVLNCYMSIHFLTVKEYNRIINIFIFHCAGWWVQQLWRIIVTLPFRLDEYYPSWIVNIIFTSKK